MIRKQHNGLLAEKEGNQPNVGISQKSRNFPIWGNPVKSGEVRSSQIKESKKNNHNISDFVGFRLSRAGFSWYLVLLRNSGFWRSSIMTTKRLVFPHLLWYKMRRNRKDPNITLLVQQETSFLCWLRFYRQNIADHACNCSSLLAVLYLVNFAILYCSLVHCTALHCTALHQKAHPNIAQHFTALYGIAAHAL